MQAYLGGHDVALTVPLIDAVGGELAASAVSYRVIDQEETELVAKTTLQGFTEGDTEVVVSIPASLNQLGTLLRGLRTVELYVTTESGTSLITTEYVIEAFATLVSGVNSFQSYSTAALIGCELPNLPGWNQAGKSERTNALTAAYRNFGKLHLRYIHDDADALTRVITPAEWGSSDITNLNADQLATLPTEYLACLRRAQILEADFLLGGDEVGEIRRSGIMSATIGESSQFFRTSKPYEGAVCKRALKEVSRYLIGGSRVGRG